MDGVTLTASMQEALAKGPPGRQKKALLARPLLRALRKTDVESEKGPFKEDRHLSGASFQSPC